MVFHGSRLVFMVPGVFSRFLRLQVGFMVFHGSRLVIHCSRLAIRGSRWVFMVFHGSRWIFLVFHSTRLVFHSSRGVLWYFIVLDWFFMMQGQF